MSFEVNDPWKAFCVLPFAIGLETGHRPDTQASFYRCIGTGLEISNWPLSALLDVSKLNDLFHIFVPRCKRTNSNMVMFYQLCDTVGTDVIW